ncbi:MAG: RDD family protein, partial [Mycobacteriales bacterium]
QSGPCTSCGNAFGTGLACQGCRQLAGAPAGVRVAGPGKRFGSYLLTIPLYVVTLGLGYLVWLLIAWSKGQNPAQQVLHMKVTKLAERRVATWGDMFVRNFVVVGLLFGVVGGFLIGLPLIVGALFGLGGPLYQTAWDRMMGTIVVDDPNSLLS